MYTCLVHPNATQRTMSVKEVTWNTKIWELRIQPWSSNQLQLNFQLKIWMVGGISKILTGCLNSFLPWFSLSRNPSWNPLPSLKLTCHPLKIDGWKINILLGWRIFRDYMLVLGRVKVSTFDCMVGNDWLRFHLRFGGTHPEFPESFVWFQDSERESFVSKKIVKPHICSMYGISTYMNGLNLR